MNLNKREQERLGLVECCGNNLELLLAILVVVVPRLFFPLEAIGYGNELGGYDNALVVANLIILAVKIISRRDVRPNLRLIHGESQGSSLKHVMINDFKAWLNTIQGPYKRVAKLGGNKCVRSESVDGIRVALGGLVECPFNVLSMDQSLVVCIHWYFIFVYVYVWKHLDGDCRE